MPEYLMKRGYILTSILLTSALSLSAAAIHAGTSVLTDTTVIFSRSIPLTNQHWLEISKHPVCTWYVPSLGPLGGCYYGEQPGRIQVSLVFYGPGMRRELLAFELPDV
jgi:hypothetical protein